MPIRELCSADCEAYAVFRRQLWPDHSAAGPWEVLQTKYFQNPLRSLCPGSGLYGFFQGDSLAGVMGAYPMPVTLDASVHPGHMLVDWAVLAKFRNGPYAGQLWNHLLDLPGRKFASVGSSSSQGPLQKRAVKIPSVELAGVLGISGAAVRLLQPWRYAHASPLHLEQLETVQGMSLMEPARVHTAVPGQKEGTAHVRRGADFWEWYCQSRNYTGGFAVKAEFAEGEAEFMLKVTEMGRFRFSALLSAYLNPYSVDTARATGRLLGRFLKRLRVSVLYATEADAELGELLKSAAYYVRRSPGHWWCIPRPTDNFRHDQVSWWLTAADRDSIYGGAQPHSER